jgi:hypothetical protein
MKKESLIEACLSVITESPDSYTIKVKSKDKEADGEYGTVERVEYTILQFNKPVGYMKFNSVTGFVGGELNGKRISNSIGDISTIKKARDAINKLKDK